MREARLILPFSTMGAVDTVIKSIVDAFGGLTLFSGSGWWKQDEPEPVRIVDIAYEPNEENDRKLYDIAYAFKQTAWQEAVYLRYGNGHVQMVTEYSCMDNGEKPAFDWDALRNELHEPEDDLSDVVDTH